MSDSEAELGQVLGQKKVAEEALASLRREALEAEKARSTWQRADEAERGEVQRRLQVLTATVADKESRLQRVAGDLASLEDQIRQSDLAAKARRDAAEREFRERTEGLEEVSASVRPSVESVSQ